MNYKTLLFLAGILLPVLTHAQGDGTLPVLEPLQVGTEAPGFTVKTYSGNTIDLAELTKNGPVVMVFYRGAWCPYCNRHMSNLQDSLQLILDKGATLIAVTPEVDGSIKKSVRKTKATFEIVHDKGYDIMKKYHVAFKVDDKTKKKYKFWSIDLEKSNGNPDWILPVPATYIIGKDGKVQFVHYDENYKKRSTVKDILEHL